MGVYSSVGGGGLKRSRSMTEKKHGDGRGLLEKELAHILQRK